MFRGKSPAKLGFAWCSLGARVVFCGPAVVSPRFRRGFARKTVQKMVSHGVRLVFAWCFAFFNLGLVLAVSSFVFFNDLLASSYMFACMWALMYLCMYIPDIYTYYIHVYIARAHRWGLNDG